MVHIVHTPSTNFNGANDAQAVAKELSMLLQNEHGKVYGTHFSVVHHVSIRGYLILNRKVENVQCFEGEC